MYDDQYGKCYDERRVSTDRAVDADQEGSRCSISRFANRSRAIIVGGGAPLHRFNHRRARSCVLALIVAMLWSLGRAGPVAGETAWLQRSTEGHAESDGAVVDALLVGTLAADRSLTAKLLRDRATTLRQLYNRHHEDQRRSAGVLAEFLCAQARHQEDLAAANALRAFYGLLAVAEQMAVLDEAQADLRRRQQQIESLAASGVAVGVEAHQLDRWELRLADNRLELQQRFAQAQMALQGLTNLQLDPVTDAMEVLEVLPTDVDCQALADQALMQRHDLRGWRRLMSCTDEATSRLVAASLGTTAGLGGVVLPDKGMLLGGLLRHTDDCLAQNVRRELRDLLHMHEQAVRTEVLDRCSRLKIAWQRMDTARRMQESWEQQVAQLEELENYGRGRPAELAQAHAELRMARVAWITRRLEARVLEIDLAESVGGLADRCRHGAAWFVAIPKMSSSTP
ncbi:MAG: hypothetical protein KatS3mg111_1887 [Pirellulaceae bacterium]|nr:MAG: hypothetical protein KatS3mg111_1887 [Pirellulaceae bacterium]